MNQTFINHKSPEYARVRNAIFDLIGNIKDTKVNKDSIIYAMNFIGTFDRTELDKLNPKGNFIAKAAIFPLVDAVYLGLVANEFKTPMNTNAPLPSPELELPSSNIIELPDNTKISRTWFVNMRDAFNKFISMVRSNKNGGQRRVSRTQKTSSTKPAPKKPSSTKPSAKKPTPKKPSSSKKPAPKK